MLVFACTWGRLAVLPELAPSAQLTNSPGAWIAFISTVAGEREVERQKGTPPLHFSNGCEGGCLWGQFWPGRLIHCLACICVYYVATLPSFKYPSWKIARWLVCGCWVPHHQEGMPVRQGLYAVCSSNHPFLYMGYLQGNL